MKAFLMYKDQDFDLERPLPSNEQALTQDLELNTLFNAMVLDDKFLLDVVKKAVLSGLNDPDTIIYRQHILKDCLKNASIVRDIYDIAVESIENKRKGWYSIYSSSHPSLTLFSSIRMLQMFADLLNRLRNIADAHAGKFESEGFTAFFTMIKKELDDKYFVTVQNHLRKLEFRDGTLISAELGKGNEGTNYTLRKSQNKKRGWMDRVFVKKPLVYSFNIHPRDDGGSRALSDLNDRGINLVANAVAQAADHIDNYFKMLRIELAFYIGCLNLHEQLAQMGSPVSFPLPVAPNHRRNACKGLYDISLALTMKQNIVGNEVSADNKDLAIITGANQGGKSTYLRSIGLAQLMMQSGMFVPAEFFSSNICERLFTHFKREEDTTMKSGKFDEELGRMSEIVDSLTSNSMVLFNESFAATNEREGSEIARQITSALLEKRIKVFFVTHQYEFAHSFYNKRMGNAIFLRAERKDNGERTFKVIEGEPLQTSFGEDLYKEIFKTGD
jgi:DNA mismatch repair ATPase MutS